MPDVDFERHVAETREARKELTSVSVYRLGKKFKAKDTTAVQEFDVTSGGEVVSDLADLAGRKFGCIYADPPWSYGNQGTRAATDNHYATMAVEDIAAMPIGELAAADAHLHLWTTNAFLPRAFEIIDAWGFEYKSCFVWVKPQMGIGNYWRVSHEFLLLGVRGNAKSFQVHDKKSWSEIDRTKHSAKPEQVRHMIEAVSLGPYLELFGRSSIQGWTVYGNQVDADGERLFAKN